MNQTFSDYGIFVDISAGQTRTTCPECSPTRAKKKEKCLSVDVDTGVWLCHHCSWTGGLKLNGKNNFKPTTPFEKRPVEVTFQEATFQDDKKFYPAYASKQIMDFFLSRKISKKTIEYMEVKGKDTYSKPTIIFEYLKDGKIVNRKYRSPDKKFHQEKGGLPILWGIDKIAEFDTVIVVEGEIDMLTCIECGYKNVLSVPNGAPPANAKNFKSKFKFIDNSISYLEGKNFVIAVDNDENGIRLQEELVNRLGGERCKVVSYPDGCKDINNVLVNIGKDAVTEVITNVSNPVISEEPEAEEKNKGYITTQKGKIKQGWFNTLKLLRDHSDWRIEYDEFKDAVFVNGEEFSENILTNVVSWIESKTLTCPWPKATTHDCVVDVATYNLVNPLKNYMNNLEWDGVERIRFLADDVFYVENNEYHQNVMTTFFVQAVKRSFEPGCKADSVLLLISEKQGKYKSTFCEEICPHKDWYLDYSLAGIHDKDGSMALSGKFIVEMSELSGLSRSTIENIRAFFSRKVDEYRPPYGRMVVKKPRRCVFIATTNDETPLKDFTGNRRYWPIYLTENKINIGLVKQNRDQYWAEAVHLYKSGAKSWYEDHRTMEHQEKATETESMVDFLTDSFSRMPPKDKFTLVEIANLLDLRPKDINKSIQIRIGFAMKKLGFTRSLEYIERERVYFWTRK